MSYRYSFWDLNESTSFSFDDLSNNSSSMTPNSSTTSRSSTKNFFGRGKKASKPIVANAAPPKLSPPSHLSAAPETLAADVTHRLFPSENTIGGEAVPGTMLTGMTAAETMAAEMVPTPPDTFIASSIAIGVFGQQAMAQPQSLGSSLLLQFDERIAHASDSIWLNLLFWPEHRRDERWCLSIDDVIHSEVWDFAADRFKYLPTSMDEPTVAYWSNWLMSTLGKEKGFPSRFRIWTDRNHRTQPVGSHHNRRPDINLLERPYLITLNQDNATYRTRWQCIKSFMEVTSSSSPARIRLSVIEKSALLFETQPSRRFVVTISFVGPANDPNFVVTLVDRSGIVYTNYFSLLDGSGCIIFARLLFVLSYGPIEFIGLDPTMEMSTRIGVITQIRIGYDRRFQPVHPIHMSTRLIGRGTHVWIVKDVDTGHFHVLKDSWPLGDRPSEMHWLEVIAKHPQYDNFKDNLPQLICGEDCQIDGHVDTTTRNRTSIRREREPPPRIHRRLVTKQIGDPLTSFRSKREFISVMLDVVQTLKFLAEEVRILHCDVSINNILINRVREGQLMPIKTCGMIIDFEFARNIDDSSGSGARSGTLPYMSVEVLNNDDDNFCHKLSHDLESIVYIIWTVCTYTSGPCKLREHAESLPLNILFHDSDAASVAQRKALFITFLDTNILNFIDPYWHDFKPFIGHLVKSCFAPTADPQFFPNTISYDSFVSILEEAKETVKDDYVAPYPFGAPKLKRMREEEVFVRDGTTRAKRKPFDKPSYWIDSISNSV